MRAGVSFGLFLLIAQCSPRGESNVAAGAPARPGGPRITELTITPEQPAPGQEATVTIVIQDDRGVRGFRVSLGNETRDVPCHGRKLCTRTLTKLVAQASVSRVTLTVVAENVRGQRARMEREITLRLAGVPPSSAEPASPPSPPASRPRTGHTFFRSGFEEGVTLKAPEPRGGDWVQYLTGADAGYDWSHALPQRPDAPNRISYLTSARAAPQQFASARIETVTGREGKPTRALYMELKKEDTSTKAGARVQYGIYPPENLRQAYVRYWIKLQPDLAATILPPGTKKARQIMEAKETGTPRADFRWQILIKRDRGVDQLFWSTWAQFGDLQRSPTAWECTSNVPVPVGEWFQLEVFWKLGTSDGRVWGAANGRVFVDYNGRTQRDSSLFVWWPFKLYVGTALQSFGGRPLYQWVDDVDFADQPPMPLSDAPKGDSHTCRTN